MKFYLVIYVMTYRTNSPKKRKKKKNPETHPIHYSFSDVRRLHPSPNLRPQEWVISLLTLSGRRHGRRPYLTPHRWYVGVLVRQVVLGTRDFFTESWDLTRYLWLYYLILVAYL